MIIKNSGRLDDRVYIIDEESPDSREKWCWLIASQGNLRDSATENIPLNFRVRVKWWGKSLPLTWQQERHCKPHQEKDQIGIVWNFIFQHLPVNDSGRSFDLISNNRARWMIIGHNCQQNPAYRLSTYLDFNF